jgi:hypothetical protein
MGRLLLWRLWLMTKTGLIASDVPQGRLIDNAETIPTDDTTTKGG